MVPVIALIGRPNVGKSTLFNRLTGTRDALVADMPGLTRDRQYGQGRWEEQPFIVIDTGGLFGEDSLQASIQRQTFTAITEADLVFLLTDARSGLTPADQVIVTELRKRNKSFYLLINKAEKGEEEAIVAEFADLGIAHAFAISALQGYGLNDLLETAFSTLPEAQAQTPEAIETPEQGIRVAIVGRPNSGKSTLINRILGEERMLAFDAPGTTRDSISTPFTRQGQRYTLIDTAGVRRKSRVKEVVEKYSVIKTLRAIESAHVVVLLIDARENISDQDLHLLGFILDAGKAIVLAVNKWDGLEQDQREQVKKELSRRLGFVDFADIHFISALHGTGVGDLFPSILAAYQSATSRHATPELTQILQDALAAYQPPLVRGRRIKLRYAHPGGYNPPLIVIHGSQSAAVPVAYQRYLINYFRKRLKLVGTPIRVVFKTGVNPYVSETEGAKKPPAKKAVKKQNKPNVKKRKPPQKPIKKLMKKSRKNS